MLKILHLALILLLLLPQICFSGTFTARDNAKIGKIEKILMQTNPKIIEVQRTFYKKMMKSIRDYKKNKSLNILAILLAFSFFYGIFHALGPGHGKVFTGSYLLANKGNYKTGAALGFGTGFLHAVSGLILVLILRFIFHNAGRKFTAQFTVVGEIISYAIIFLIGSALFVSALRGNHSVGHKTKSFWGILLSAGLIPCPGAILIASFTILHNMTMTGIFMIFSMALGMGISVSASNILVLSAKQTVFSVSGKFKFLQFFFNKLFPLTGAAFLIIIGLALIAGRVL